VEEEIEEAEESYDGIFVGTNVEYPALPFFQFQFQLGQFKLSLLSHMETASLLKLIWIPLNNSKCS